eukprot:NODE_4989_length_1823_cov_3.340212.p1 GENE.NODE_4989_length_1823_cov_3.340212~~NODE_4989_length_1823_cov_3.340212.p1  ORF type:complete len:378 (+),score=134.15 NODE_4989_length_1823_cov_3.340212:92-1225(+)
MKRETQRKDELATFQKEDTELTSILSALDRASAVLHRDSATMLQAQRANGVAGMLRVLVDASVLHADDATKLTSMLQSSTNEQGDDANAPASSVYEHSSGSIVDVLEDLRDKAQVQQAHAREVEEKAAHDHALVKQAIEQELANTEAEMGSAKKTKNTAQGNIASDTGDLKMAKKNVAELETALAQHQQDCNTKTADYAAEKKSRDEELAALSDAKKAIEENTGAATSVVYGGASFLQMATSDFEVVRFVRKLAKQHQDPALDQLEKRLVLTIRTGNAEGSDPFGKVKGLLTHVIEDLTAMQNAEGLEKAWCDEELAETRANKTDIEADQAKRQALWDKTTARINELSTQISNDQSSIKSLMKAQQDRVALRNEEHT